MKRTLLPALALTLLAACSGDQQPLAPLLDAPGGQSQAVSAEGATVARGEFIVKWDRTPFSECAGERLHVLGDVLVRWHRTTSASGGLHLYITRYWNGMTITGLETGRTWRSQGVDHRSFNLQGSGPWNFTWSETVLFQPDDPSDPLIMFRGPSHISVNAQNEITAEFDHYQPLICVRS